MRNEGKGVVRLSNFFPARPGRGWLVVGAAFLSHFLSYGVLTVAFGVFFPFMAETLQLGRTPLSAAWTVNRFASAALSPFVGALVDRRGPRLFTVIGVASLAAGAVVLAGAHAAWTVVVGYGIVMALGAVALGELTADATVTRWFARRRSRALAAATMGLSAAGIVVPVPLAWLIARAGWRTAWLALAVAVLVIGVVAALGMRDPGEREVAPQERGPEITLTAMQATRTRAFWLLVISTNLGGLALFGINLHLFSYVRDKGLAPAAAAGLVTYLYILHTLAKPLWGLIAERMHVRYCIASCYAGGALGVVVLTLASDAPGLVAFATIYGLTRGAQSFVTSLAWAEYFGRHAQSAIRGVASVFRHLAAAVGPLIGGLLFDLTGTYTLAFTVFASAFALGGLAALIALPPKQPASVSAVVD